MIYMGYFILEVIFVLLDVNSMNCIKDNFFYNYLESDLRGDLNLSIERKQRFTTLGGNCHLNYTIRKNYLFYTLLFFFSNETLLSFTTLYTNYKDMIYFKVILLSN